MKAEQLYKAGGLLLSVAAIYNAYLLFSHIPFSEKTFSQPPSHDARSVLAGLQLFYSVILLFLGIKNVVISRAGIPLGLFRIFTLMNTIVWGVVLGICIAHSSVIFMILHGLIFLFFLASYFSKPEFE